MDAIIQKTRELGALLLESDECKNMRLAEAEAMNDPETALLMQSYLECKTKIQELLIQANPDSVQLQKLSDEMDAYQDRLAKISAVVKMSQAQAEFSKRIEQVNATLKFIITGEVDDASGMEGDCSGNCAHCKGCH